jgi:hypothetical protein
VSTVRAQPRPTPEERADTLVELEVDEALAVHAGMRLEERDGIAKLVRLTSTGLDVELFHVLSFT